MSSVCECVSVCVCVVCECECCMRQYVCVRWCHSCHAPFLLPCEHRRVLRVARDDPSTEPQCSPAEPGVGEPPRPVKPRGASLSTKHRGQRPEGKAGRAGNGCSRAAERPSWKPAPRPPGLWPPAPRSCSKKLLCCSSDGLGSSKPKSVPLQASCSCTVNRHLHVRGAASGRHPGLCF